MYYFGMMFMFEISIMDEKQRMALAGMKIWSKGRCTIIYRVVISIHSFFIETPSTNDRNMFVVIAPVRAELAVYPIFCRALVAAIYLEQWSLPESESCGGIDWIIA